MVGVVSSWPSQEYVAAAEASKRMFAEVTEGIPQAEWCDINRGSDTEVIHHVTELARHTDLVVLGQRDERAQVYAPPALVEEILEHAGRPVLVFPYAGSFDSIGKRPLIAWSDTREAARALNDALPLMKDCNQVLVLSFGARREEGEASCVNAARHLACHGINASTLFLSIDGVGVMDMLLNKIADTGSDLLVMGGHSHTGIANLAHGMGTRQILQHMTVPVLMSC